jgi:DNA end-binding protein Ku
MPRPLWSGSLNFGLVNVPIRLTSAVRDLDLHFRQLHAKDHTPLETRRVCSKEDKEVAYDEIGNAYDLDGKQVILTDDELSAADPKKTKTIEIESFVALDEIDPIYFDHPYFLIPAGETDGTVRAYRLLAEVMAKTDRVALGRFVMRTKEYLVAIRAREQALTLSTMRFHDEVRPAKDIGGASGRTKKAEVERAVAMIEAMSVEWDPEHYDDEYRKRLQAIVRSKRKGGEIKAPKADSKAAAPVPDLMAALEETLDRLSKGEKVPALRG